MVEEFLCCLSRLSTQSRHCSYWRMKLRLTETESETVTLHTTGPVSVCVCVYRCEELLISQREDVGDGGGVVVEAEARQQQQ